MVKKFAPVRGPQIEIKLSESLAPEGSKVPKRIQILRTGTFHHPEYGKMVITHEHFDSFVRNLKEGVRGIDIMLDVAHDSDREAAAWFKNLVIEGDALFAEVEWTPFGEKKVADKEFRYTSADFHLDYQDNETLKKYGPTLLGAGLTNRPVIKGMEPVVQLSEFNGGVNMLTLEQAMARIAELEQALVAAQKGPQMGEEMKKQVEGLQAQLGEANKEIDAFKTKEEEGKKAAVLAEKKGKFDKLLADGKAVEAQRAPYMAGDSEKFAELAMDPKSVRLSEEGGNANGNDAGEDAEDKVLKLAEGLMKEKKAKNLGDAVSAILSEPEHAELAKAYNNRFKLTE